MGEFVRTVFGFVVVVGARWLAQFSVSLLSEQLVFCFFCGSLNGIFGMLEILICVTRYVQVIVLGRLFVRILLHFNFK